MSSQATPNGAATAASQRSGGHSGSTGSGGVAGARGGDPRGPRPERAASPASAANGATTPRHTGTARPDDGAAGSAGADETPLRRCDTASSFASAASFSTGAARVGVSSRTPASRPHGRGVRSGSGVGAGKGSHKRARRGVAALGSVLGRWRVMEEIGKVMRSHAPRRCPCAWFTALELRCGGRRLRRTSVAT